jgi:hypothetical protein
VLFLTPFAFRLNTLLQPQRFRDKWRWLSAQRYELPWLAAADINTNVIHSRSDPNSQQIGVLMGPADSWPARWAGLVDNDNGGQTLHFRAARLISYDDRTSPFAVYGEFFTIWDSIGGVRSGLGHPIADPQFLADGTTCLIFEGGHVHQIGKKPAEV